MIATWRTALLAAASLGIAAASPAAGAKPAWAVAVLPSGAEFTLEIAADPDSRSRGYMGRESVGPREGMLFVFERPERHGFWMKNCLVPLDMIWLDDSRRVVDVSHSVPPCPPGGECPEVRPKGASRYVLEIQSGAATRHGLKVGDQVVILSDPALP